MRSDRRGALPTGQTSISSRNHAALRAFALRPRLRLYRPSPLLPYPRERSNWRASLRSRRMMRASRSTSHDDRLSTITRRICGRSVPVSRHMTTALRIRWARSPLAVRYPAASPATLSRRASPNHVATPTPCSASQSPTSGRPACPVSPHPSSTMGKTTRSTYCAGYSPSARAYDTSFHEGRCDAHSYSFQCTTPSRIDASIARKSAFVISVASVMCARNTATDRASLRSRSSAASSAESTAWSRGESADTVSRHNLTGCCSRLVDWR